MTRIVVFVLGSAQFTPPPIYVILVHTRNYCSRDGKRKLKLSLSMASARESMNNMAVLRS